MMMYGKIKYWDAQIHTSVVIQQSKWPMSVELSDARYQSFYQDYGPVCCQFKYRSRDHFDILKSSCPKLLLHLIYIFLPPNLKANLELSHFLFAGVYDWLLFPPRLDRPTPFFQFYWAWKHGDTGPLLWEHLATRHVHRERQGWTAAHGYHGQQDVSPLP